jgi:lysophospholipase L1-like esterase
MTDFRSVIRRLPRPVARQLGRVMVKVAPGIRHVHSQVALYAAAWDESNATVVESFGSATHPLWVVLGDSTAQGIGAHSHEHGYVGHVRACLEERSGRRWHVLNLSKSGARVDHVLEAQLPALESLGIEPDLVSCAIGANDLVRRTPQPVLMARIDEVMRRLPPGSVIATLPQGLRPSVAVAVNDRIRTEAAAAGLKVADVWAHTTGPWTGRLAADGFHPNAHGYEAWAAAFLEVIDA